MKRGISMILSGMIAALPVCGAVIPENTKAAVTFKHNIRNVINII